MKPGLRVLTGRLSVWRLPGQCPWAPPSSSGPDPATVDLFFCYTRTAAEISIVCSDAALSGLALPPDAVAEHGMRALEVAGPLDFGLTGIVAGLSRVLAHADVPIFVISTYNTDYLLVRETLLERAVAALRDDGYDVVVE